jgi:dipeptidyl aminopeptidase/acylaminoacyl peptidase
VNFFCRLAALGIAASVQLPAAAQTAPRTSPQTAASSAPPAAATALIPTADLAVRSLISGPKLSPDGKWVLALLGTATPTLGLISTTTPEIRKFSLPKQSDLVFYRWAGNGRILVSLGKTEPWVNSDIYATRLIAYDVDARTSRFIGKQDEGPKGDDILYVDPDGQWMLLAIQRTIFDYPSVFRVDLNTGKMSETVHQQPEIFDWFADSHGVVRGGVRFTDRKWSLIYRRAEGESFRRAGSARFDDTNASLGLMRFALDSDQGFILSNKKTGRDALYRFDFSKLETGELVFESTTNDISDYSLSQDGTRPLAAYYTDDRDRVEWFDPKLKEIQAALDQAVPGKEAWIVSRSRDDELMIVLVTGANDPGGYYYFKPAEGTMHRMAAVNEHLRGRILAASKPVTYKARDGLLIHAYLTLPPGRPAKGLPLIVMPHGGPYGVRDNGDYDAYVQLLANRGYAVLQPNYRGSDSYGRAFEEKGDGQWGRAMQDDLDDGMDWLVHEGIADAKRVCLVGASYGGYAALWGATRNPERYRCAASLAGVADVARQLRYSRDFFANGSERRQWETKVKGRSDFKLGDISPLDHITQLRVPVLLAHGKDDQRVPIKQSDLYARAAAAAGKPYEYYSYENEGHGLSDPAHIKDYMDRLEAFLNKYNPAG